MDPITNDAAQDQGLHSDAMWPRAGAWLAVGAEAARKAQEAHGHGDLDVVDVALLGIGTWRTSLSPTRADTTPAAIRGALARYSTYARGVDLRTLTCIDAGDVRDPDGEEGEQRAIAAVSELRRRAGLILIAGGDNAATYSAAIGSSGNMLANAGLITLDAHHDLRDGVSNGSPVRRLIEAGLDGHRIVQIGIADFANSAYYAARAREAGITVIARNVLHHRPMSDVMAEALEIAGAGGGPIHVDLDIDVCDRGVAPGCPASVPGGIAAHEIRDAAYAAGLDTRVTSLDVTEVDAASDTADQRTVRLAALCLLEAAAGRATTLAR